MNCLHDILSKLFSGLDLMSQTQLKSVVTKNSQSFPEKHNAKRGLFQPLSSLRMKAERSKLRQRAIKSWRDHWHLDADWNEFSTDWHNDHVYAILSLRKSPWHSAKFWRACRGAPLRFKATVRCIQINDLKRFDGLREQTDRAKIIIWLSMICFLLNHWSPTPRFLR